MTDPHEPPVIEVTVGAPADAVWNALRDRGTITQWFGWEYEGLAAEIDLIYFKQVEESPDHRRVSLGGECFELLPAPGGTTVRLTRAPLSGDPEWDAFYDEVTEGWTTFLHQLKFALELHPDEARRTLFYSGHGGPPEVSRLVEGTEWFTTEFQHGLRVPAWGDGLLVTAYNPAKGAVMAVLTTYGFDDEKLAALDATWKPWWAEHYPEPESATSEA